MSTQPNEDRQIETGVGEVHRTPQTCGSPTEPSQQENGLQEISAGVPPYKSTVTVSNDPDKVICCRPRQSQLAEVIFPSLSRDRNLRSEAMSRIQ